MAKNKRASQTTKEVSKTVKILSFASISLVLGLIAANYFFTSLNFHQQVFFKKNAVENQLEENAAALEELESGYERLKQQGPKPENVFSALPTSSDFPLTSATLESIVQRSGVNLTNVSVYEASSEYTNTGVDGYASTNPEVQQLQVNLDVTGSYSSIQDMIERLEESVRVFRVESADFSGTQGSLTGKIVLTGFYAPAVDNSIEEEVFSL